MDGLCTLALTKPFFFPLGSRPICSFPLGLETGRSGPSSRPSAVFCNWMLGLIALLSSFFPFTQGHLPQTRVPLFTTFPPNRDYLFCPLVIHCFFFLPPPLSRFNPRISLLFSLELKHSPFPPPFLFFFFPEPLPFLLCPS